ncbi:MAG: SMC-Scp complex subunit ScpB [Verrucomicrobia bacterium]|nr:MAG: SMC-Scp complex subunit ScpB [Verrucomicrobiota bacterium]
MSLIRIIEALLFSAQKPLSISEIATAIKSAEDGHSPNEFSRVRQPEVAAALEQLKIQYIEQERAFQLTEKAEGWQLATDPKYAQWVRQLFPALKPARLSAPALETLAIIAYRQPITRADVEAVRGVNIDGETTQFFLDHFGLRNLDELPNVEELRRRDLPASPASAKATVGKPTPATTQES